MLRRTLLFVVLVLALPSPASALTDAGGLHIAARRQLDSRLTALTLTTPALVGSADVDILLPAGYSADPSRRYPVLYLFTGTSGRASDWVTMGKAAQTTAGVPLIVVMPDIAQNGSGGGWCVNSDNAGAGGPPEWETFHIDELLPFIDANLRTIPARRGRAIFGLSQGGFCSMSYAARHPDLFAVAGSFSGAPDIAYDPPGQVLTLLAIDGTAAGLDGVPPDSFFGDPVTNEVNWADHDPATLAPNLRHTDLFEYTGNGLPGPLDTAPSLPAMGIEAGVHGITADFHNRLVSLGIPDTFDDYGPGTHSWPYWARDLQWAMTHVMDDLAHPPADPASVTYTTAYPTYRVYG